MKVSIFLRTRDLTRQGMTSLRQPGMSLNDAHEMWRTLALGGTIVPAFRRTSVIHLPARTWQIGRQTDLVLSLAQLRQRAVEREFRSHGKRHGPGIVVATDAGTGVKPSVGIVFAGTTEARLRQSFFHRGFDGACPAGRVVEVREIDCTESDPPP
jgi:hypothetical protein